MSDDAELLRRYAEEKSEAAFAELVGRYVDLVYAAGLRQVGGDTHRAQDVTQIVFTTLARKAGSLVRHPVLAGWLYTTTYFAAEKIMRSERRRRWREQEVAMQEMLSPPSPTSIDWDRVRPVLDAAMRELAERDREAVLLRFFARRPFADIAAALNLSEDAARMRVERALQKLHALLSRRGFTSTAGTLAVALSNEAVAAPAGLALHVTTAALAGSATGPGFFAMISISKVTPFVTAAVILAALGTGGYETYASRAAANELATANTALDAQQARLRALVRQADTAEQQVVALQQSVDDRRTAVATDENRQAAAAGAASAATVPPDPVSTGTAFLAAHPEVKQALLERSRARVEARYGPLWQKLGLTQMALR